MTGSPSKRLAMILPAKHINILDSHVDRGCFLWNGGGPAINKVISEIIFARIYV